ncbi:GIY-YIG nuclease family protein [Bifidobacterium criceti]|uniref:Cell division protein FtsZ n=1 Tax=Bifidobacterium criceti TaxID=1960969 RepID=A0A2A2EES4_9BIFI|nr:GIY-YIG nuclease family protein [Bifidobacterium criceti]PAU67480.1 cell division protein FtsZ [Bifidobacterium criceti]
MAKHSIPTINFFEMMGISEEELSHYLIRLNKSSANWFDVMTLYYEKHDELMNWVFTRRWNSGGRNNGNMPQSKVLQFIQLDGNENPPTHWLFVGAYEILGTHVEGEREIYGWKSIERFQPFEARTVVTYRKGKGSMQLVNNMGNENLRHRFMDTMIVEKIAQSPVSAMPFPGYANVRLSFDELAAAVHNDEWRGALSSISAVYLQTDTRTGWHYVGSAYSHNGGSQGLLSRWEEYVGGDHTGGNILLKELVAEHGASYIEKYFQYSILDIFDPRVPNRAVIEREHWWMDTLSSVRHAGVDDPHGYNSPAQWKRTADGEDAGTD